MTEYVILERRKDVEETWFYTGTKAARSASSAIRAHLNGSQSGGMFVAVPLRSWQPTTVKVETKTSLKFS